MPDLKNPKVTKRDAPTLSLRAALQPATVSAEKRTVQLVWTTGAPVLRRDWDGSYFEELSLDPKHVSLTRLNNGAPFLAAHDSYSLGSVMGVVESASLERGQGVATVRFPAEGIDPDADMLFRKIQDGIIQNVSVGYSVRKFEKREGGDSKVPTYLVTDWEPFEISAVPVGADDGAGFRSFLDVSTRGVPQQESNTMTEEEKRAAEAKQAEEAKAAAEKTRAQELENAIKAERARGNEIRAYVKKAALSEDFAEKLITDGKTVDQARAAILDAMVARSDATSINSAHATVTDDQADKRSRGLTAALLHRAGFSDRIKEAVKKGGDAAEGLAGVETDPGEFRGISLLNVCRELLESRGVNTRRMSNSRLFETAVLRSGYQTASEFSVLFENVMHKAVLAAFALQSDTWRMFCGTDRVPDFRDSNRFRTGSLDVLDSLTEHGEYQNKSIPDGQKQVINTATKGNVYAISRQTFISDDMGALSNLFQMMGRAAARTIEEDVYELLTANAGLGANLSDSNTFFHATRGNIGTGAALGVAGLDADRVTMLSQKDMSDREYLDLRPHCLLVPVGLGGQARQYNDMQFDGVSNKFQVPNIVRGLFKNIVESPRITGTRRYLFADPSVHPAIKVVFLEESGEAPLLDSEDGWRVDGVEYKVRIDAKAQFFEPKAAVTNAGT